jgi:hypothetical protein
VKAGVSFCLQIEFSNLIFFCAFGSVSGFGYGDSSDHCNKDVLGECQARMQSEA